VEREKDGELASPTLAELYFSQGFIDRALEVYRRLLAGDPRNDRLRARLAEIEDLKRQIDSGSSGASAPTEARRARRAAVERSIMKLERLLAATRRDAR
jgi:cytochrome c-type biogenesis protein CcmH/NrfG